FFVTEIFKTHLCASTPNPARQSRHIPVPFLSLILKSLVFLLLHAEASSIDPFLRPSFPLVDAERASPSRGLPLPLLPLVPGSTRQRRPAGLPGSGRGGGGTMVRPWIHARPHRSCPPAGPVDSSDPALGTSVGAAACTRGQRALAGGTKGGLGAGHRILLRGRPPAATSTGSPCPPAPPPAGAKVCYPRGRFAANSAP
ncbi:unnamed protein product, partial [Urochloa humidicola]